MSFSQGSVVAQILLVFKQGRVGELSTLNNEFLRNLNTTGNKRFLDTYEIQATSDPIRGNVIICIACCQLSYIFITFILVSIITQVIEVSKLCKNYSWPEMWDSHIIIHLFQGAFWIDYRSIWCRDFTIICITNKL